MKTNSKIVRGLIRQHIIDSVYNEEGQNFDNISDVSKYIFKEFERVANHPYNLKRIPNNQERFSDYLNGLPFNFLFYYSDIKEFLNGLGINPNSKEYSDKQSLKTYHYLIYTEVLKNK